MADVRQINAPSAPQAAGGYSQAISVDGAKRLLFISGQIPENSAGELPTGFEDQARQAWANVLAQLAAADMTVANLVKVTTYLATRDHALPYRKVRAEVLGEHRPALTVVIAGIFDEKWLLEIEAYAAA